MLSCDAKDKQNLSRARDADTIAFVVQNNLCTRCGTNELVDISLSDAWLHELCHEKNGEFIIIITKTNFADGILACVGPAKTLAIKRAQVKKS